MLNDNKSCGGKAAAHQSGFTLVELAIVLVIIGLVLAAVLKGQEMIQNAKVKGLVNEMKAVATAYYSYQDRYKAIPGDDANATAHLGQAAYIGSGDGIIGGAYTDNNATVSTEAQAFWQHTRLAGFMNGSATAGITGVGTAPAATNSLGGILGLHGGITGATVYGMIGAAVCTGSIPWKTAQAVDTVLDDGNSNTGNVRAGLAATPAMSNTAQLVYGTGAADPASTDQLHTICMKI